MEHLTVLIVGLAIKLRLNWINNQLNVIQLKLRQKEVIIIDGKVTYHNYIGRLYLTCQRVVFLPKSKRKEKTLASELSLDKISHIHKSSTAGLITNGITLKSSEVENTFPINFPDD